MLNQKQKNQMDQAFILVKKKNFLSAGKIYSELAQNLKNHASEVLMLFNAGTSYKEAGSCKKALLYYQQLLNHSLAQPSFKARTLIEISYVRECLGQTKSALFALKKVEKFRSSLPWSLNQIVYPARLSIAYAFSGKLSKASDYQSLSLTKILHSKTAFRSEKELNTQMSRIFYLMGRSYIKKEHLKEDSFFRAFPYYQIYLLQSVFLKNKIWSELSKKELNLLFDKLAFAISKTKDKKKYKHFIIQTIKDARVFVKKEKLKNLERFYFKKSQPIIQFLSK